MAKPTILPEFAWDDLIDPTTLEPNVEEPGGQFKQYGWHPARFIPIRGFFNWLHRHTYLWLKWVDEELDVLVNDNFSAIVALQSDMVQAQSDIIDNANDIAQNQIDIGTNTTNIGNNTTNIATNTGNIATNTGDISAIESEQIDQNVDIAGLFVKTSVVGEVQATDFLAGPVDITINIVRMFEPAGGAPGSGYAIHVWFDGVNGPIAAAPSNQLRIYPKTPATWPDYLVVASVEHSPFLVLNNASSYVGKIQWPTSNTFPWYLFCPDASGVLDINHFTASNIGFENQTITRYNYG